MSFMFQGGMQQSYYKLYNIKYEYLSVVRAIHDRFDVVPYDPEIDKDRIRIASILCNIYTGKLNDIGTPVYRNNPLSKAWLKSRKRKKDHVRLKNNIYNWFKHVVKGKSKINMWSTLDIARKKLAGLGYKNGFVAVNCRATNDFRRKTNLVYAANMFVNPFVEEFFRIKNVGFSSESFALAIMVQWMYRSAIRENKRINMYIPAKRMRNLLETWLGKDIS